MNEFRADLHCHTTCSDGTLTPKEIIHLAKKNGLSGLSITDHDTVEAYDEAISEARAADLALISGVEFSANHANTSVHILGYAFVFDGVRDLCNRHKKRREDRNRTILSLLAANGMPLTEEEVLACTTIPLHGLTRIVGRPHIAQAMIKKGYIDSVQNAFKLYIGEGKPCYAPGESFSVDETIDVIHGAKGYAIIAHPHLINNESLIPKLLSMEFDGIEGYYAQLQSQKHERWIKIAKKKEWLITGGSDFHGTIKPNPLGCSWVGEETFRRLEDRYKENT